MAASGFTPIQLYRTTTAAAVPSAGDLTDGELAINLTDEALYFKNASGVVKLLANSAVVGGNPTFASVTNGLGTVGSPSYTFTGDTNTGMWSPSADAIAFSTAGSERARITSSGQLETSADAKINGVNFGRGLAGDSNSTAAGRNALIASTTGSNNTAVGSGALFGTTTGNGNTAVGNSALLSNTTGGNNTAVGSSALSSNTAGVSNTAIGTSAGSALTTGSNNTIVGQISGTAGLSGTIIIGAGTTERMRIDNTGNMGLGTSAPSARLDVRGTVYAEGVIRADSGIDIAANVGSYWRASLPSGAYLGGLTYNSGLRFYSGDVVNERMRIDSTGRVGINEAAPDYRLDVNGTFGFTPGASVTPVDNGDVVFELTNNTTLTIKAKGSDGVVRSGTITLA